MRFFFINAAKYILLKVKNTIDNTNNTIYDRGQIVNKYGNMFMNI